VAEYLHEEMDNVLYLPGFFAGIGTYFCSFMPRTVWNGVQSIVGYDRQPHIDLGQLPMMARNDVGGTSTKNMVHWVQMIRSQNFQKFDYGKEGNMKAYGQESAPKYDISSFDFRLRNVPCLLFVGDNDVLVEDKDFQQLMQAMPAQTEVVRLNDYHHLDYMWAIDASNLIYDKVHDFVGKL